MRQIKVGLQAGGESSLEVDGVDLSAMIGAVRILYAPGEIPAVQVEIRGNVEVDIPEGLVGLLDGTDPSALLAQAIDTIDPAGFEQAILDELGGLDGGVGTTGEAAKAALQKWAAGYGGA